MRCTGVSNMFEQLKEIIKRVMPDLDVESVTEESKLVEDLKFDSLAFMMMAMEIEAEFNIRFDGPIKLETVGDVIKYIQERQ